MKPTNSLFPQITTPIIGLLLLSLMMIFPRASQPGTAPPRTNVQAFSLAQAKQGGLKQPTTPVEKILNKDGTLNLNNGFAGSLDPSGWQMTIGSDEKPHFVRAGIGVQQLPGPEAKAGSARSVRAPLVSGDENWDDRFSLAGVDGAVGAIAISGTNVYVGGTFTYAAEVSANNIARWDSASNRWYALGSGVSGSFNTSINAIAISGSEVYVGGWFTTAGGVAANDVARWDSTTSQWYPLGAGVSYDGGRYSPRVHTIAISGNNVYVGGLFTTSGGVSASNIARWDSVGNQWYPLGGGINGEVWAIAISGSDVYVGGYFTTAGGVSASNVARWDSTTNQWYPLGSGVSGYGPSVMALGISGNDVYVGGLLLTAGGASAYHIARWNSASNQWYALGSGVGLGEGDSVEAIAISGSDVYVGGAFGTAGGVTANRIARWDSATSQWHSLDNGTSNGLDTGGFAIGISGSNVYVGGSLTTAGGVIGNGIARWDAASSQWYALNAGTSHGLGGNNVLSMADSGSDVYVGGSFTTAGGVSASNIARWDINSSQWYALGSGVDGGSYPYVAAIAISGSDVYVGGSFTTAGGVSANNIARWDAANNQWYALGSGTGGNSYPYVYAIAISGTNVYVGGYFTTAGGVSANHIARWDSASNQWYPLASGSGNGVNGIVQAIVISGSDMYVGGYFTTAGGVNANCIARWDINSNQWYPLASGSGNGVGSTVNAIRIIGSDVYVGGIFRTAGGTIANRIARWDAASSQWYALGSGVGGNCGESCSPSVNAIGISGSSVYIGGVFTTAGGASAYSIARWDSVTNQWYALGSGAGVYGPWSYERVNAIATNALDAYTGGDFTVAGSKPSYRFGIWHDQWLASHMTWQGRPSQPDTRLQLPITLTLKSSSGERNYPSQSTNSSAYLTVGVGTLPAGTYNWRAKNPKYLANSGTIALTGAPITSLDMGLMRAGDANNDNSITALDFNIVKISYGLGIGDPGYDDRADFNGDNVVTISDFNLLKVNFGQSGAPPIGPRAP